MGELLTLKIILRYGTDVKKAKTMVWKKKTEGEEKIKSTNKTKHKEERMPITKKTKQKERMTKAYET